MLKIKEINKSFSDIETLARITKISFRPTKKGTEYADIELTDKTGIISAKKWNVFPKDKEDLKLGIVVKINAGTDEYKGGVQLIINDYQIVDIVPEEFVVSVIEPADELQKEFEDLISSINNEQLKNICLDMSNTEMFKQKFWVHPAASSCHHAEKKGLMYHTIRMMRTANELANVYNKYEKVIDRDMLITAAFFHDLGKMREMEPDAIGAGVYVKDSLLGHIYLGAQNIHDYEVKGMLDEETSFQLQHCVLSHHGKLEWGSPVVPSTNEAILLHMIDNMDAKLFACQNEGLRLDAGQMADKGNFCLDGAKVYKTH